MSSLFTPKQVKALERASAECQSCRELATVLASIGMPNDYKREENDMIAEAVKKALELHRTYQPPTQSG